MISRLRQIFSSKSELGKPDLAKPGLRFSRPLIVFQSDDWGRVGVRDREGWDELVRGGLELGEKAYDYYSLETAYDLEALTATLGKHRDSVGRHPCLGMNFITANVDFGDPLGATGRAVNLRPLTEGLPEPWERPKLMEAYRHGIREGLFFPALHGLTHFCRAAIEREIAVEGERRDLVQTLWRAGTPYIHWRMPWIGYEYWDPSLAPERRFPGLEEQRTAIGRAAEIFQKLFGRPAISACAPGYRANDDTKTAWFEAGVRVVQGGPGDRRGVVLDSKRVGATAGDSSGGESNSMLLTFRNVEIEPAVAACELGKVVKQANENLARGVPAIVSVHSINFHSTLRDFRTRTLALLDGFLEAMEKQWPDLLYVHDGDLWQIVDRGALASQDREIKVAVTRA